MKGNLSRGCAIDANHMQFIANLVTIGELAELRRRPIRKYRAARQDRNREPLGKLRGRPQMVGIGNDDAGNHSLVVELSQWRFPQRNWINNKNSIRSDNRARTSVRLHRLIVRL